MAYLQQTSRKTMSLRNLWWDFMHGCHSAVTFFIFLLFSESNPQNFFKICLLKVSPYFQGEFLVK